VAYLDYLTDSTVFLNILMLISLLL